MPHFIVTFRIKNDDTYQKRYDSLVDKAKELAESSPWQETTSFIAFKSKSPFETAASICSSLYTGSDFSEAKDIMVVIDLDAKKKATKGKIEYPYTLTGALGF